MSYQAVAEDGSRLTLLPDTDNWAALQSFCNAHTTVTLPEGVWRLSKALNVRYSVYGRSMAATTLHHIGTTGEPVLGIGGDGRWASSVGFGRADGVRVGRMTLWQTDDSSANNKCLFHNGSNTESEDFHADHLRAQGSAYEGIVVGSNVNSVVLRHIEALDCGAGGPAYIQTTAGINATSSDLLIEHFLCRGCGQGVETGNTRVTVRKGLINEPASSLGPFIGVNVGSTGYGVWRVYVEDCTINGYDEAITTGNGIGRLAGVYIRRNIIHDYGAGSSQQADTPITFAGGIATNSIHHANEGPDTEGSEITDNTITIHSRHNGAIGYNSGVVDNGGVLGREPLLVARNRIVMVLGNPASQTAPILFVAGEVGAAVQMTENIVEGLPSAPIRGDLATFTNGTNPAIPGMPNLTAYGNVALNATGAGRPFVYRIEA